MSSQPLIAAPLTAKPPEVLPAHAGAAQAIRAALERESERLLGEFDRAPHSQRLLRGLATPTTSRSARAGR